MKPSLFSVSLAAVLSLGLWGCGSEPEIADDPAEIAANDEAYLDVAPSGLSAGASGTAIPVQSDPGVSYALISSAKMANGNLEVVTQRNGSSGVSFARREIDCDTMSFRYLGEGDTLAEAEQDGPNPGEMAEAMSTSISGEVSRFACAQ